MEDIFLKFRLLNQTCLWTKISFDKFRAIYMVLRGDGGFESGLFPLALVSAGGLVPDLGFRLVVLPSEGADEVDDAAAPPADAVDDESA